MLINENLDLFCEYRIPKTRYQGSKYKLRIWIESVLKTIEFNTVLDGFSGTSTVSYLMKSMGKKIYCNDNMLCNYYISIALIQNNNDKISKFEINDILKKDNNFKYETFIENTFKDVYYTNEENKWLDIVVQNINKVKNINKKSMYFWALYQACLSKRPYNLFHRKNLYIREANVDRSFGNKKTWDTSFEKHFIKFINEINRAVFSNEQENKVYCEDVLSLNTIDKKIDLVYLDPPYIPASGSITQYNEFYHFLNGISDYDNWADKIDYKSNNLKIKSNYSVWEDKKEILNGFDALISKFKDSKIVISYRNDGIPSIEDIKKILVSNNKKVRVETICHQYALSTKQTKEVIVIGE